MFVRQYRPELTRLEALSLSISLKVSALLRALRLMVYNSIEPHPSQRSLSERRSMTADIFSEQHIE